jgi:hypothetical protein
LCVAGCNTVTTTNQEVGPKPVTGNFYFLPRGKIRIVGAWNSKDNPTTFLITISQVLDADPRERFFLEHSRNSFYDDEVKVTVNEKGLLTTVNTTSEDKSAAIAGSLAGIVGDALRFGAGVSTRDKAAPTGGRQPFNYVFDPFSDEDVAKIRANLIAQGLDLHVIHNSFTGSQVATPKELADRSFKTAGVVFRPLRPVTITIDDQASTKSQMESQVVLLPDPESKLLLDFGRVAFVKKVTNVTFVDGTLREVSVNRPSQVLGVLAIPKEVLKAIVPLPLEIKQTQLNNINAEKNLIDAEKALRAAEAGNH